MHPDLSMFEILHKSLGVISNLSFSMSKEEFSGINSIGTTAFCSILISRFSSVIFIDSTGT